MNDMPKTNKNTLNLSNAFKNIVVRFLLCNTLNMIHIMIL